MEIVDWIRKNFTVDCNWTTGNCYYFAVILRERFGGDIYYDVVNCHFVIDIKGKYYDFNGEYNPENKDWLVLWEDYKHIDTPHAKRITKGCILKDD